jgi:serine/threonine protein kinase
MHSPINKSIPDFSSYGYQALSELGHNFTGGRVTYKATEIATDVQVVIKQFQFARTGASWSGYNAMQREIETLQGLDHPGIPKYLNSFETNDGLCLVQEYKDAQPLSATSSFTLNQIQSIADKTLEILSYLQSFTPPVIHRDLKPENILVDEKLNVYLVDFGFARSGGSDLAMSSVVVGTTGFMPPEQLLNQKLTTASDLYGLGATLVCLLAGIKSNALSNYIDETYSIDIDKILHAAVGFEFKQWLKKLIAPNQSDRFSDANTARQALLEINMDTLTDVNVSLFKLSSTPKKIAVVAIAGISSGAIGFGIISLLNSSINIYTTLSLSN